MQSAKVEEEVEVMRGKRGKKTFGSGYHIRIINRMKKNVIHICERLQEKPIYKAWRVERERITTNRLTV